MPLEAFSWKETPALIEQLFPVQKISTESYKEQMAGSGKTLTALGSYWKGRKPLILNKACVLGSLMPVSDDPVRDLEIFELLMGMDDRSLAVRFGGIKPADIARRVEGLRTAQFFDIESDESVPALTPFDITDYALTRTVRGQAKTHKAIIAWKESVHPDERLAIEALALPANTHRENVAKAKRPEELGETAHTHIWKEVNAHLGTSAQNFPELVEEMGIARFGRRPRVADVFSGSGQIPFEAARLGCDVYASDLNPIACMLTWGAFNIVGASAKQRAELETEQQRLAAKVKAEIDALNVEQDGKGWHAKVYLYCAEVRCPETGWMVPLIPSLIVSKGYRVIAQLIPRPEQKRYDIDIVYNPSEEDYAAAEQGTVQGGELVHCPDGTNIYRTKISTLRGDYKEDGINKNKLRLWEKTDFIPRADDVFQERLYCVQWMRQKPNSKKFDYDFRAVTEDDLEREAKVIDYIAKHLGEWQEKGYVPDMQIEKGYNTDQPIRERGWTHWHHLFNPRHLLTVGLMKKHLDQPALYGALTSILDFSSKLSRWTTSGARIAKNGSGKQIGGASNNTSNVFYNQALNTFYNWGCRSLEDQFAVLDKPIKHSPIVGETNVICSTADGVQQENDLYITDPPYGDAVKYEEITEFFIAWLRKNPPKEFADWTWDSRRALAIKGEDEAFRQGMIAAYRKMAEQMPDNGLQVLMFTHQSGSIWADMANIIWASGLQVTAAWYVVTETDSALRQGANVKGTVLLVLRKRQGEASSYRDDLGWEIEDAVKEQIEALTGLDQKLREKGSEALYNDADLQMAGYAAALKVLTAYSRIDGKDMVTEAEAPKQSGRKSFVEELIDFAVQTAVQFLVPVGFEKDEWQKLSAVERFYLKMTEMEHQGEKSLDNYQNFAKAFKVKHFDLLMSDSSKANNARLKLSNEFKNAYMSGEGELQGTPLRALLYALYELSKDIEIDDVLLHLLEHYPNYLQQKQLMAKIADYLAAKRGDLKASKNFKPDQEAQNARILAEAIRNQKL